MGLTIAVMLTAALWGWTGFCVGYCAGGETRQRKMKRIYAITTTEGDVWGVPAEVIADNYAKYYERCGGEYKKILRL